MKKILSVLIVLLSASVLQLSAQSLSIAQALLRAGNYTAARKEANLILRRSPNDEQALRIIQRCDEHDAELDEEFEYKLSDAISQGSEAVEQLMKDIKAGNRPPRHYNKAKEALKELRSQEDDERYSSACKQGEDALRRFVENNTEKTTKHFQEAKVRLQEYDDWNSTMAKNTKTAFQSYLAANPGSSFASEARNAIVRFEEAEDWTIISNGNSSENQISNFIDKYPESPHSKEAKYLLNVKKGDRCFSDNQFSNAKNYYVEARNYKALPMASQKNYDSLILEEEYGSIMGSSDLSSIHNFLTKLPVDSKYHIPVSNKLAMLYANQLDENSNDYAYNKARQFVKTEDVRLYVENKIEAAEKAKSEAAARHRAAMREMWWEDHFQAGYISGLAFGGRMHENESFVFDEFFTGLNARFHFGAFAVIFGANYQYNGHIEDKSVNRDEESNTVRNSPYNSYSTHKIENWTARGGVVTHQVVPRIGFQIGKSGEDYDEEKFFPYFACYFDYGINFYEKKKKYDINGVSYFNKKTMSIVPMVGANSWHYDLSLYCRLYLPNHSLFKKEAYPYWGSHEGADMWRVGAQFTYKF